MNFLLLIADLLSYLSPIFLLVVLIMGLLVFFNRKKTDNKIKIIIVFLSGSLLIDLCSRLSSIWIGSNLIFINIYGCFELITLYYYLRQLKKIYPNWYHYLFYFILAYNIVEFFFVDFYDYTNFQSYSKTINSLFLLIVSITVTQNAIRFDKIKVIDKILMYMPIYFTISGLIGLPVNLLVNFIDETVYVVWSINVINIMIFYFVILLVLWKYGKIQKL